ncbi:MAG: hypothetical protein GQ583_08625 [Methyloprofundus sp.]|nr:hypothetical protein [Methyloprofundus sp.]
MARLAYSKASLSKESAKLKRYKQFLPSLDLKRQQLAAERKKAQQTLRQTELEIEQCYQKSAEISRSQRPRWECLPSSSA